MIDTFPLSNPANVFTQVLSILKRVSDEDCRAIGLDPEWARPDWMVMTMFPVPPPPVRPSILMDTTTRGEDDLTHKLSDIIKVWSHTIILPYRFVTFS
jgi:DNA-directed RNA polymerase beta' subunit